ncbi:hypothetical protein CQW23_01559 [Capsicum baccatum]|uniref:Fe2OG dioxygenase domain-containing protein n=1 Tax=Capsicum baccatum TaxID=33114 RepID=A0A2G2XNX9_CAPBA|nr:hypothetical protein CQW23_01559 [Capsicum baccatum]
MASTKVEIPTIDFCNHQDLKPNTSLWESTKVQVFEALKEFGCFVAIYDKVPNDIEHAMFDTFKEVCDLPLSKLKEYIDKPYHIYDKQIPRNPTYSTVRSADLLLPNSVETFANTFWPHGEKPNICNVVKSYYKPLMELDEMVRKMVLESLGLQNYIDEFFDGNSYLLRFTNYKAIQGDDGKIPGLGPHTDGSYLTIITQDQNGLQVNKNGEWIDFNTTPNSYVVLSSDAFKAWTNGKISAAVHRVDISGDNDRLSIQLFSTPNPVYTVEAPKELVDEVHPLLFKPFKMLDYYAYVLSGAKKGVGLKYFCGV